MPSWAAIRFGLGDQHLPERDQGLAGPPGLDQPAAAGRLGQPACQRECPAVDRVRRRLREVGQLVGERLLEPPALGLGERHLAVPLGQGQEPGGRGGAQAARRELELRGDPGRGQRLLRQRQRPAHVARIAGLGADARLLVHELGARGRRGPRQPGDDLEPQVHLAQARHQAGQAALRGLPARVLAHGALEERPPLLQLLPGSALGQVVEQVARGLVAEEGLGAPGGTPGKAESAIWQAIRRAASARARSSVPATRTLHSLRRPVRRSRCWSAKRVSSRWRVRAPRQR